MAKDGFTMTTVVSRRVAQLGYNAEKSQVRAIFPNGRAAIYENVPQAVFHAVLGDPSIGAAFGSLIANGGYAFEYE